MDTVVLVIIAFLVGGLCGLILGGMDRAASKKMPDPPVCFCGDPKRRGIHHPDGPCYLSE